LEGYDLILRVVPDLIRDGASFSEAAEEALARLKAGLTMRVGARLLALSRLRERVG
jgi:hypothetical protein